MLTYKHVKDSGVSKLSKQESLTSVLKPSELQAHEMVEAVLEALCRPRNLCSLCLYRPCLDLRWLRARPIAGKTRLS